VSFEPQKFFIGLVGFFSVLMPGALLAYLAGDWIAETFLRQPAFMLEGVEGWAAFLFVSYLLGHFVFLFGSTLDDLLYKPVRDATTAGQVRRLAYGQTLSHPRLRRLAGSPWLFHSNPDAAVLQAQRIRTATLAPIGASEAVNAYQWSKARLSKEHPEGLLAVERFEADSKFFRSFAVVLFVLFWVFLLAGAPLPALVCLLLVIPALWRYADQRFKATQQAYWFVLMLEGERTRSDPRGGVLTGYSRADGLTHAGGVVFRVRGTMVEYLLVEASGGGGEWVLPKGHIETFEAPQETSVREVREEAGVWARVVGRLDDVRLLVAGRDLTVRFYLMESLEESDGPPPEGRRQRWLPLPEAVAVATHEETRELLGMAERMRR
jgi:8-oxo-dGTP pyrophosphatase MutT (NUDIX family)